MKNYSDLLVTKLLVRLELEVAGHVDYVVTVDQQSTAGQLIEQYVDISKPFSVEINVLSATGNILIKQLAVDGIDLVPRFDYLATYHGSPTSYLDKVGKWTLTFDRPFYQWYHQITGQGWLLEP